MKWPAMSPDLNPVENQRKEICCWANASIKVFGKTELKIVEVSVKMLYPTTKEKVLLNWLDLQRGDINSSVKITPIFFKSRCKFYFTISYFMISLLLFMPTRT